VASFLNIFGASSREGGSDDSDKLVTKLFEVWFCEVLLTQLSCSENLSVQENMQVPVTPIRSECEKTGYDGKNDTKNAQGSLEIRILIDC